MMKTKYYQLTERNSLVNRFMVELRDHVQQRDRMRFRRNLQRVAEVLAYEISKSLVYEPIDVPTVLGVKNTFDFKGEPVIASILRAGLPFHEGFLHYFDRADSAFISAYRDHDKSGAFQIKIEYMATPSLEGKTLIMADPMLATGHSIVEAYRKLCSVSKPTRLIIAALVASPEGIAFISQQLPQADIYMADLDERLNEHAYILPGLGDAGDLIYGEKMKIG